MKSRPRRWLSINGKVNTLSGHLIDAGYSKSYASALAKRHGVLVGDLPASIIGQFFGGAAKDVDRPDNWQEIMYGSSRGAQRNVPKGAPKPYLRKDRTLSPDKIDTTDEKTLKFLTMRLNNNPTDQRTYY